jgi:hypothetical protein
MRRSNKSRSRNKSSSNQNQRRSMGNIPNRVFESAGPDGKVRGTPQQIIDKYNALGRDAQVSGDRVAAENYLQHSEHYSRLLGEATRQQNEQRQAQEREAESRAEASQGEGGRGGDSGRVTDREERGQSGDRGQDRGRDTRNAGETQTSGLTTIETDDDDRGGPVDTPESRSRNEQVATPEPASDTAPQAEATPAAKPRRPRTRRRAPTADGAETKAEAAAD